MPCGTKFSLGVYGYESDIRRIIMRFLTISLTFLLALAACAPVLPRPVATTAPVVSTALSSDDISADKGAAAQYETSVPAALWDSKTSGYNLVLVEPSTGEPAPGHVPLALGVNYYYAFSPDGKTL